jgi:hypothetical protein
MKHIKVFVFVCSIALLLLAACKPSIKLGEEKRIVEGGFKFNVIPGYTYSVQGAQVMMTAPNATTDTGPLYMLSAGEVPEGTTLEGMVSGIIGSPEGAITTDIKVAGLACKAIEVTDSSTGTATFVKFIFCLPKSTLGFLMAGAGPKDVWDKEAGQYFTPLVSSISFFEPEVAPTQQP